MKFCSKKLNFTEKSDCIVIGIYEGGELSNNAKNLDKAMQQLISDIIASGDFKGSLAETFLAHITHQAFSRLLLVGYGKKETVNEVQYKKIIKSMAQALKKTTVKHCHLFLNDLSLQNRGEYWTTRFCVETILDTLYIFEAFKSKKSAPCVLEQICLNSENSDCVNKAIKDAQAVALGVSFAKNVANSPPNVCNPAYLAELAKQLDTEYSTIKTTIVDEKQMAELKMNSYLAVSQGSENPAYMSVIEYKNAKDPNEKPIVLVGKGLTFDSGGISIKPSASMDEMKYDMGGAASVYGTMKALAELQLPINVIGILAGCENMPDGKAYRPGDILTTMSGKTVEVLNTDAEGRLVLCDVLTYVERFEPKYVVDIATLTGACVVGLGHVNSGLLSKDDSLAENLLESAKKSQDYTWRLPMNAEYEDDLKSNFADLANVGSRAGGSITAGIFLSYFAENYSWAHLDIAGTAWKSGAAKGSTGRPVPLLTQFLMDSVEK